MAPISKLISFLFVTILSLSLQINARDSQFFSKITPIKENNNVREVPNNEEQINKPEEQPVFTPETENSYGLYGHESGLNPPSTTYKPYKTTSAEEFNNNNYPNNNNNNNNYNYNNNKNNNNNYNFQKGGYNSKYQNEFSDTRLAANSYNNKQQNELSDTKFTEGGYNSMENQNENNKYYYNNNAANDNGKYYFNNNNGPSDRYAFKNKAVSNGYKGERLGMSDTRFMEGGKYFYNVNSEKYNPTTVYEGQGSSNSENWYDNKGYFGNNRNVNKNSMEGYQNQEEFEEDQQEFEP